MTEGADTGELDAGRFSTWLTEIRGAIDGRNDADVPCGSCTECCTASQFVHITPDESDTIEHIPSELLFPAPGLPRGHVLLGYDERGHCPMLSDGACTIYEHRPRTCRTYDCRVFPAAGVIDDDPSKAGIAARAGRWRFDVPTSGDRRSMDSIRAAAALLHEHGSELSVEVAPHTATQRAVLAVEIHELFLDPDPTATATRDPGVAAVQVELTRRRDRGS